MDLFQYIFFYTSFDSAAQMEIQVVLLQPDSSEEGKQHRNQMEGGQWQKNK